MSESVSHTGAVPALPELFSIEIEPEYCLLALAQLLQLDEVKTAYTDGNLTGESTDQLGIALLYLGYGVVRTERRTSYLSDGETRRWGGGIRLTDVPDAHWPQLVMQRVFPFAVAGSFMRLGGSPAVTATIDPNGDETFPFPIPSSQRCRLTNSAGETVLGTAGLTKHICRVFEKRAGRKLNHADACKVAGAVWEAHQAPSSSSELHDGLPLAVPRLPKPGPRLDDEIFLVGSRALGVEAHPGPALE